MGKVSLRYNPALSIKENAKLCGVTESAVRKYIQRQGIDRAYDNKAIRTGAIKSLQEKNPTMTLAEIAHNVGCSASTVKRCLQVNCEVKIETEKVSKFDHFKPHNIIRSVANSQNEILVNILRLYVKTETFDCDLTFSKGGFYKVIKKPLYRFDKYPLSEDVQPLKKAALMSDGTMSSIIFDLPFIVRPSDDGAENSIICNRFSYFRTVDEMFATNDRMLELSHRLLKKNGYLIVKTMDTNYAGKQYWVSTYVQNKAQELGFSLEDIFILTGTDRSRIPFRQPHDRQVHARKYHSYFLVFKKKS